MINVNKMNQYDISTLGFLPECCVQTLPKSFAFLQDTIDNLSDEISGSNFRKYITTLPNYDIKLHSTADLTFGECKYLYSILAMIMNRYIWCTGGKDANNYSDLPQIIGIPLFEVSEKLGITMVLTHAAVDLWNWRYKNDSETFCLDNIEVINSMTGNISESWFYKIMIAIEGNGGKLLNELFIISKQNDLEKLNDFLIRLESNLAESVKIIKRMYDHCDPSYFFNQIRIYLSGSINDSLPNNVKVDLTPIGKGILILKYNGGSAAQSTLIQVYDNFLGVTHEGETKQFLEKMRLYMPKAHTDFLYQINSIKDIVLSSDDKNLIISYNKCVDKLNSFRCAHLGLVQAYIMRFIAKNDDSNVHGAKGSGGTNPEEFCRDVINDVVKNKI